MAAPAPAPLTAIVINMDRDTARLAHMRGELERAGLPMERFAAISGAALPADLQSYFPADAPLSPGEIGCYASHLRICQQVASGERPSPALVLEDDLAFGEDFAAILVAALAAAPPDWDMVRLSNTAKHAMEAVAPLTGDYRLVRYSRVPGSTGASLISQSGARKFLTPTPRYRPIDQDLKRVWAWGLDVYGVHPMPLRRDIFDASTIDQMAAPGLRRDKARLARLRRQRLAETPLQIAHGVREWGWAGWLDAELTNIRAALTPKSKRARLLLREPPRP